MNVGETIVLRLKKAVDQLENTEAERKELGPTSFTYSPPSSEKVAEVKCGVCKDIMLVQRNLVGPTSFVEAMCKKSHEHDSFFCEHSNEDWHVQVVALRKEAERTSSSILEDILFREAEHIVKTRVATKKVSNVF